MRSGRWRSRPDRRGTWLALAVVAIALAGTLMWWGARPASDVRSTQQPAVPGPATPEEAVTVAPTPQMPAADLTDTPPPAVIPDLPDVPQVERSQVITDGSRQGKMVALTFDDNYAPELALPVLDALDRARAPATLFVVGGATRSYPEVAARIAQNPLVEVGDHSGSHSDLTRLDRPALEREIGAGVKAYRELTGGHASRLFRAPGGHVDAEVLDVAAEGGFPYTIAFDPGPPDYEGVSAATIVEDVRRRVARAGGIVLLHFNAPHTAEALPDLVFSLRARGYRLVTVSELLRGDRLWFDVDPQDPAYPAIVTLSRAELMSGFATGDYGACEPMSRADLAVVLARCLGLREPQAALTVGAVDPPFADVREGAPGLLSDRPGVSAEAVSAIAAATSRGLMQGGVDADGRRVFWPFASVRRVDLALAVAAAAAERLPEGGDTAGSGQPGSGGAGGVAAGAGDGAVTDLVDLPGAARAAVAAVVEGGFMDAPGGRFSPWVPVGRAEAAVVVHRLVQITAPRLIGQRGLPDWWRGGATP